MVKTLSGIVSVALNLILVVCYSLLIGAVVAALAYNLHVSAGPLLALVWAGVRIGVWLGLQMLLLWLLVEGLKASCLALYALFPGKA